MGDNPLAKLYYSLENAYYKVLDSINHVVPVYKITDPIDRVFPSFVLVLLLILGGLGAFLFFMCSTGAICEKPAEAGPVELSCADQVGSVCQNNTVCMGTLVSASDTYDCCVDGECKVPNPAPPGNFQRPPPATPPTSRPPACQNECAQSGALDGCFSTTALKKCGQFDTDACLEWGPANCASGQTCQAGECKVATGTGGSGSGSTGSGAQLPYNLEFKFVSNNQPVSAVNVSLKCDGASAAFFENSNVTGGSFVTSIPCLNFAGRFVASGKPEVNRNFSGRQSSPQTIDFGTTPPAADPTFQVRVEVRQANLGGGTSQAAGSWHIVYSELETTQTAGSLARARRPNGTAFFQSASPACETLQGNQSQNTFGDASALFQLTAGTYRFTATNPSGTSATNIVTVTGNTNVEIIVTPVIPNKTIYVRVRDDQNRILAGDDTEIAVYNNDRIYFPPRLTINGEFFAEVSDQDAPYHLVVWNPSHLVRVIKEIPLQPLIGTTPLDLTLVHAPSDENIFDINLLVTGNTFPFQPLSEGVEVFVCQTDFPFALNYNPLTLNAQGRFRAGGTMGGTGNKPLRLGADTYATSAGGFAYPSGYTIVVDHPRYFAQTDTNTNADQNRVWNIVMHLQPAGGQFKFLVFDKNNLAPRSPFDINVTTRMGELVTAGFNFTQIIPTKTFVTPIVGMDKQVHARISSPAGSPAAFIPHLTPYYFPQKNNTREISVYVTPTAGVTNVPIHVEYRQMIYADGPDAFQTANVLVEDKNYFMLFYLQLPQPLPAGQRYFDTFMNVRIPYRQGEHPIHITDVLPVDPATIPYLSGYPQYSDEINNNDVYLTLNPRASAGNPGAKLANVGIDALEWGEYPVLVKINVPATTPRGYEFDVRFEAKTFTPNGNVRSAPQGKRFKIGSGTCAIGCLDVPELEFETFFANANEEYKRIDPAQVIPITTPENTRLKFIVHNNKNETLDRAHLDLNARGFLFGPYYDTSVMRLFENQQMAAFEELRTSDALMQTAYDSGNPLVDINLSSVPGVLDGSNRFRLTFRAPGLQNLSAATINDPILGSVGVLVTDNLTGEPAENATLKIWKNTNPQTAPAPLPAPSASATTNANGQALFTGIRLSGDEKLFIQIQKSGYKMLYIQVDARAFNHIEPEDPTNPKSCLKLDAWNETTGIFSTPLPALLRNGTEGRNRGMARVSAFGCDQPYDITIAPHGAIAGFANTISIRPARFTLNQNETKTFEIGFSTGTPLGVIPIVASAKGTEGPNAPFKILEIYSYDQAPGFDLGAPETGGLP